MEEREVNERKLHEATAAANQTVNQKMHEMASEIKRSEALASAASAASTDDIRKGRAAQVFNDQLATELREARATTAAAKGDVTRMEPEQKASFEQQIVNEVAKAASEQAQKVICSQHENDCRLEPPTTTTSTRSR